MTEAPPRPGKLDISHVAGETIAVLRRNLGPFLALSAVLAGIPGAISRALQGPPGGEPHFGVGLGLAALVGIVAGTILQATLVFASVEDLEGRRPTVAQCLSRGLNAFLPLLGLGILMAIAICAGFVLLIVPGVMIACAWAATTPALVIEGRGILAAFPRSAELTRGHRWQILALGLLYVVVAFLIEVVAGVLGFAVGSLGLAAALLGGIASTLLSMIVGVGVAALYLDLRRLLEGGAAPAP